MSVELTTTHVAGVMRERGYEVHAGPERAISGGAADSRLVKPGDLFTAFRGEQADGNAFVQQALEAGAVAAICERMPVAPPDDATIVIAPDAARAVSELAAAWRTECAVTVVGITGTVGKTTTKDLVAATLAQHYATHSSPGNFNSREGLPLAIMSLRRDHEVSILEMAMDSPGEIAELCAIARPDAGIVTNIGLTHVSKLGSIDAIQREKLSLPRALETSGTAILNIDDTRIAPVVAELRCKVIGFGAHHEAQLRHGPVTDHGLAGTTFTVHHGGDTAAVRLSLPGAHVVPAAMAAIGCCLAMGMSLDVAADSVSNAEVDGRIRLVSTSSGATIIDDRYNSSPASLEGALRLLSGLGGQRIAVVGEMAELGEHGDAEHRRIGEIAASTCDALFASGPLGEPMVDAARAAGLTDAHHFASKEDAAAAAQAIVRAGDHILVKASRGHAFETIIPMLGGEA